MSTDGDILVPEPQRTLKRSERPNSPQVQEGQSLAEGSHRLKDSIK